MDLKNRAKLAAYLMVGCYSVLIFLLNINAPTLLSRVASLLPLVVVGMFALYDNVLWHLPGLLRLGNLPDIRGSWRGKLVSYRRDQNDKQFSDERDIVLVIRQTYTALTVTLLSAESKSRSAAASVIKLQRDDFVVQYQYQSDPKMAVRSRSSSHSGGATLQVSGVRPSSIEGEYWTARSSQGTMDLTRINSRKLALSFDDGMNPTFGQKKVKP